MDIASNLFDHLASSYRKLSSGQEHSSDTLANQSQRSSSESLKIYDIHYKREQSLVSPPLISITPSLDSSLDKKASTLPSSTQSAATIPPTISYSEFDPTSSRSTAMEPVSISTVSDIMPTRSRESVPTPIPLDWSWITTPTPPVSQANRLPTSATLMTRVASSQNEHFAAKENISLQKTVSEIRLSALAVSALQADTASSPSSAGPSASLHPSTSRIPLSTLASEFVLLERTSSRGSFRSVHSSEFGDPNSPPASPNMSPIRAPDVPTLPLPQLPEEQHISRQEKDYKDSDKHENPNMSDDATEADLDGFEADYPWFRCLMNWSSTIGMVFAATIGSYVVWKLSGVLRRSIMKRIL